MEGLICTVVAQIINIKAVAVTAIDVCIKVGWIWIWEGRNDGTLTFSRQQLPSSCLHHLLTRLVQAPAVPPKSKLRGGYDVKRWTLPSEIQPPPIRLPIAILNKELSCDRGIVLTRRESSISSEGEDAYGSVNM